MPTDRDHGPPDQKRLRLLKVASPPRLGDGPGLGTLSRPASGLEVLACRSEIPLVFSPNLGQLHDWWTVVSTSTAPNLAGQDNVSIAGMYAAWMGVGASSGALSAATVLIVLGACAWAVWRGSRLASPDYLDAALLLFVMPLLSPQGWDYVLLMATPAVMLLFDRLDEFPPAVRGILFASLAVAGLSVWDVLGREPYRALKMSRVITVGALFEVALVIHLRARRAA